MTVNVDPLCPQQHTHPKHDPSRCIFCEYGAAVRADALDAAREAIRNREDGEYFPWVQVEIAVAAIDSLRGES